MLKVVGFQGIGDTFYQRPAVRALAETQEVALSTPFPELYHDIPNLHFWYKPSMFRVQAKAQERMPEGTWLQLHKRANADLNLEYGRDNFKRDLPILEAFTQVVPQMKFDMTFPLKPEWVAEARGIVNGHKVAIIRRPTCRQEYNNPARNPRPGAIGLCVAELKRLGYWTVAVGDLAPPFETATEDFAVDQSFEHGELSIPVVAALLKISEITVTPVGYAVPMAMSVNARCFTVFGGHVAPSLIFGLRTDMSRHRFVAPDPFCNCVDTRHNCKKDLSDERILSGLHRTLTLE